MERHFGLGSVAQADGMARFEPSYSCINNDDYAPVSPPSPFEPLGGDSPFSCILLPSRQARSTDPFDDPDLSRLCTDARHPEQSVVPGNRLVSQRFVTYRGNMFEGHSKCMEWIWKHNTAQYMWENFHLFAGPQGFKSSTDRLSGRQLRSPRGVELGNAGLG